MVSAWSIAVGIVSIFVALPLLTKGLFYFLHRPKIHIAFENRDCPLFWREFPQTGFSFRNDGRFRYIIEYEIRINQPWDFTSKEVNQEYHTQFKEGLHVHRKSEFADWEIPLAVNSARGPARFPLEPKPENAVVKIVVFPEIEAFDVKLPFGIRLPRFFERIPLRPIKKECRVTNDLDEFYAGHDQARRLRQLHDTLADELESTLEHPDVSVDDLDEEGADKLSSEAIDSGQNS